MDVVNHPNEMWREMGLSPKRGVSSTTRRYWCICFKVPMSWNAVRVWSRVV